MGKAEESNLLIQTFLMNVAQEPKERPDTEGQSVYLASRERYMNRHDGCKYGSDLSDIKPMKRAEDRRNRSTHSSMKNNQRCSHETHSIMQYKTPQANPTHNYEKSDSAYI